MASLSEVVFMVEGRRKSGSLLTAKHALDRGVTLCSLPGSPLDERVQGNLHLLADGALMIRDDKDLYMALSRAPGVIIFPRICCKDCETINK